jgi:hypothetical protein
MAEDARPKAPGTEMEVFKRRSTEQTNALRDAVRTKIKIWVAASACPHGKTSGAFAP